MKRPIGSNTMMRITHTFLLLFTYSALQAIHKPSTFLILDKETREPLPFTNIVVQGKNVGTVSNSDGYFVLDIENYDADEIVLFSYVGYETLSLRISDLKNVTEVYLIRATVNLNEIQVLSSGAPSVERILKLVRENYSKNHVMPAQKQRIFFHQYEKVPFSKENQLLLKKSNFEGMDNKVFEEIFEMMPEEFIGYQDAVVDLYSENDKHRLIPIEAVSLEEGSQKKLYKEIENKLSTFMDAIEKSKDEEDVYFKFRTGIIGAKIEPDEDDESIWEENKTDSLNYTIRTNEIKNSILFVLRDYANIESKNWEFVNSTRKYRYTMGDVTVFNDELVYEISFSPKNSGVFEGKMYISTSTYGILQLDYAYAEGKQTEKIQILGLGHSMNHKKGRVIYEKREDKYLVKYVYAEQQEFGSIDRNFVIKKKQKRPFFDKELNEMKLSANLAFDMEGYWEILIQDRSKISASQFEAVEQPSTMKFRKEYAYTPEMWSNRTVLAPNTELQKYKRSK